MCMAYSHSGNSAEMNFNPRDSSASGTTASISIIETIKNRLTYSNISQIVASITGNF